MYRIDNSAAVPHTGGVPAPAAPGPNPDGYFTGGNPGSGVAATRLDADWFNAVQEELAGVIVAGGLALDKTDRSQVLKAGRKLWGTPGNLVNTLGHMWLAGGLLVNWGITVVTASATVSVNYDLAFPNSVLVGASLIGGTTNGQQWPAVINLRGAGASASNLQVINPNTALTIEADWIVLGF